MDCLENTHLSRAPNWICCLVMWAHVFATLHSRLRRTGQALYTKESRLTIVIAGAVPSFMVTSCGSSKSPNRLQSDKASSAAALIFLADFAFGSPLSRISLRIASNAALLQWGTFCLKSFNLFNLLEAEPEALGVSMFFMQTGSGYQSWKSFTPTLLDQTLTLWQRCLAYLLVWKAAKLGMLAWAFFVAKENSCNGHQTFL